MKVILLDDVAKVGRRGDVRDVSDGFARNFLIPKKLALSATAGNLKNLDHIKKQQDAKAGRIKDDAEASARASRRWPTRSGGRRRKRASSSARSPRRTSSSSSGAGRHGRAAARSTSTSRIKTLGESDRRHPPPSGSHRAAACERHSGMAREGASPRVCV